MKLEDIHYQISRFTKKLQKLGQSGLGEEHTNSSLEQTLIYAETYFMTKVPMKFNGRKDSFFPINVLEPLDICFFHMNVESTSPNTPKFIQDISRFQM